MRRLAAATGLSARRSIGSGVSTSSSRTRRGRLSYPRTRTDSRRSSCRRALPGPAGGRARALRRREDPDPGARPQPTDAAEGRQGPRPVTTTTAQRDHQPLRCAGSRHRPSHRRVHDATPPGVPGFLNRLVRATRNPPARRRTTPRRTPPPRSSAGWPPQARAFHFTPTGASG